jgi:hypothetical protein
MPKDLPEQLQFEFGRIDPVGEQYPRRHEYRQISTMSELLVDAKTRALTYMMRPTGKLLHLVTGVALVATYPTVSWIVDSGTKDDEQSAALASGNESELENCSDGIEPNMADLQYEVGFNYSGLYDRLGLFDLDLYLELMSVGWFDSSLNTEQAIEKFNEYLEGSPFHVDFDINLDTVFDQFDITDGSSKKQVLNKKNVANLMRALYSIPRTLYEYAGIRSIRIVDEIKSLKSEAQIAHESKDVQPPFVVDKYFYPSGQYNESNGVVILSLSSLENLQYLVQLLYHEVIGHGVMIEMCEPNSDLDWRNINASSGLSFDYVPIWKRTEELEAFFSSNIVTNSSYGGTNAREDVAEISQLLAPIGLLHEGLVDAKNGTITDDKARLLFSRICEIEPDFGRFLTHQQFLLREE